MPRARQSYTPGDVVAVFVCNPATPVRPRNVKRICTDEGGVPAGCRETSAGLVVEAGRASRPANQVFTPLELLKRMAQIRRRIRREMKAAGLEFDAGKTHRWGCRWTKVVDTPPGSGKD